MLGDRGQGDTGHDSNYVTPEEARKNKRIVEDIGQDMNCFRGKTFHLL